MGRHWNSIVSARTPSGGLRILRLFSDGADAYRFVESLGPTMGTAEISLVVDGSHGPADEVLPHRHYWAVKSWTWENYRWEHREPMADCIPVKDACPCGKQRSHVAGTPWPPASGSPLPDYELVRAMVGPRPRASRRVRD